MHNHTPDSALRALRSLGVFESDETPGTFHLPAQGPGIKGWGTIDYLKSRGYVFVRAPRPRQERRFNGAVDRIRARAVGIDRLRTAP